MIDPLLPLLFGEEYRQFMLTHPSRQHLSPSQREPKWIPTRMDGHRRLWVHNLRRKDS